MVLSQTTAAFQSRHLAFCWFRIHPSAPHAFAVLTPAVRWVQIVAIRLSDGSLKELYQTLQEHICDRHVMGCSIAGNSAGGTDWV